MTTVELHHYEQTAVRTVEVDGRRWAVASDICRALEIGNVAMAVGRLEEADVSTANISSGGQRRRMSIVSEGGATDLVLDSRKPKAKAFRRWLTHEVWPAIRDTGTYSTAPALTEEQIVGQAFMIQTRRVEELTAKLDAVTPAVEAYEAFLDGDGYFSVGTVAKMLGLTQNKLFDELRNRGILIAKGHMRNTPYQRYMAHFVVRAHAYERDDEQRISYTTKVQASGVDFIRRKLAQPLLKAVT